MAINVLLHPKMIILSRLHAVISSVKQMKNLYLVHIGHMLSSSKKSPIKVPSNPYYSGAIYCIPSHLNL